MMYLHRGMWENDNNTDASDALGNTWTQDNGNISINMNTINGIQTRSSYFQVSWVMHLLQNLFAWSIVILTSLSFCMADLLIY